MAEEMKNTTSASELRRKADENIASQPQPTSDLDAKRLLHELQVHQVELEMQNLELSATVTSLKQEITDRKEAEAKLHIIEEKFSTTFHLSPDSININRLSDGMYVEINEGFTAITGYTAEEVIGKTSLELNIWDNPEDRSRLAKELKECGIVNNLEATFRRKDGTTVVGLMSARVIKIEGEPCILSISRDISIRKQTERLLKASEERYRTIFEQSLDAIFYTNPDGAIYKANPSACSMFGMTEQELCAAGRNGIINRDDPKLAAAIADRKQSRQINTELTCVRKNGEVFPAEVSSVITSEDPPQSFVIIRDISERKRIEQQLLQSQKMEAIGQLAGGVAHDFNNKLMAILGYAELAKMDINDSDKILNYLDEMIRAAEHSRDITCRLLTFSRQQVVTPQVLDANKIIAHSLKSLYRLIGEHVSISFEPCENLWNIGMDPVQLDQVVMKLSINARDAMPDGGSLIIETRNTTYDISSSSSIDAVSGDYVMVTFCDTGTGMDKETLTHIFEPFFTTKEVGKGTGLGLATIYGIIRQNSGFIDVTSSVAQGTEFKVYIPRHFSEPIKEPAAKADSVSTGSSSILLVEDEDAVRNVVSLFLKKIGYTVHEAATPTVALELADDPSIQIDLVLTDYVMPGMNGKVMMERIHELRPRIRCIYASGFSTEHVQFSKEEHFMQKPYDLIKLSGLLKRVISGKEVQ